MIHTQVPLILGGEWRDALFFDLTPQPHQNANHLTWTCNCFNNTGPRELILM